MLRKTLAIIALIGFLSLGAAQNHENVDTVIMASTANFPDAMISAAPANKLGVPVILTKPDELSQPASDALSQLQPSEVVIVGGPSVVSDSVEQEVSSQVNTTQRLWGVTQVGTSVEVSSHFWAEGSDEAVIVQYPQDAENSYKLLAAVKSEVQDEDEPILISKEGTLSASVLSEVERLGATEVEVYSTSAKNVTQDLQEIGVQNVEVEEAELEELTESVENKSKESPEAGNTSTLVIVAAANFRHAISAPVSPNSASFIVSSEEQISEAVEEARETEAETIKVTGKPDLAQRIASEIENQTDRDVEVVSGDADESASKMAIENRREWHNLQKERMENWKQQVNSAPGIQKAANKSITRAEKKVNENSSEKSRELLQEAKDAYQDGEYFEAKQKAQMALSESRVNRFQKMGWEDVQDEIRDEREDFHEAVKEIRETNQEFSQKIQDAETMEERLEIIEEFKEERREAVKEMREEARENRKDVREERRDRKEEQQDDRDEVGQSEVKLQMEGNEVKSRIEYMGPTAGYNISKDVRRSSGNIQFVYKLESPDGMASQVVTRYRERNSVEVENGTYTASVVLNVDGEKVNSLEEEITVPGTAEFESESGENETETSGDDSDSPEMEDDEETENETENGTENQTDDSN